MGHQITVRNVPADLATRLKAMSKTRGESLNSTILGILRTAAGIDERRARLQRYVTWTREDLEEFEKSLRAQRTIDDKLWK